MIPGAILGIIGFVVGFVGVIILATALPVWVFQWIIGYF